MAARKVSLRAEHQAHCPNKGRGSLDSVDAKCRKAKCRPAYFTFRRDPSGKIKRGEKFVDESGNLVGGRFTDKQTADRVRDKLQRALDEGRASMAAPKTITLPAWVDEFEEILAAKVRKGDLKPRSERGYMDSLRLAAKTIGHVELRQISRDELRTLDDALADHSPATRARHLKHLSLALTEAIPKYLETNPVPDFKKRLNLNKRIPRRGKAPFEEGELARLWPAFAEVRGGKDEPVYRYAAEFGVETGMRIGELAALDWPAVSGDLASVRVDWTYNDVDGLVLPKDGEQRIVHLTAEARAALEAWIGVCGVRESGPVFPSPRGGRISIRNLQRRLESAMVKAGIPKTHPTMRLPRSFHSLRYSTSVLMQRRGYHPRFIEQTLGHGTLELSFGTYGHWTPEQLAAEAAKPSWRENGSASAQVVEDPTEAADPQVQE